MKLTGKLKEKVSKAETKEQAKELIANAGMELTDEEIDQVSGGKGQTHTAPMEMCRNSAVEPSPALKHFMDIQRSFGR